MIFKAYKLASYKEIQQDWIPISGLDLMLLYLLSYFWLFKLNFTFHLEN